MWGKSGSSQKGGLAEKQSLLLTLDLKRENHANSEVGYDSGSSLEFDSGSLETLH